MPGFLHASDEHGFHGLSGQEVTVSATEPSSFLYQMETRPMDGIRVVSEFPDVFSEDLPEEGRGADEDIS